MARPTGRVRPCGDAHARARLNDAEAFLRVADGVADDPDVIATNAIHAAIAAADAICCLALRQRSAGQNHRQAIDLIAQIDPQLATDLGRALDFKSQAAYDEQSLSTSDAERCVGYGRRLVEAARDRLREIPGDV